MRILLPSQLIVALILFLNGFLSSELKLSNNSIVPTSSETPSDKPHLPAKLSSMQYESVCVNIYGSETTSSNKKIYFYSPIAPLNYTSIDSIFNQTSSQGLISFSFSIWNEDLGIKVAQHLSQILNQKIELNQVQVFPFNSVRLTTIEKSSVDFLLNNEWITYENEPSLKYNVSCSTRDHCDRMMTELRRNPKPFEHLRLDFSPQLNDETCFNDGVKISQEDLSTQVTDLLKRLEETKLNFIEELTKTKQELLANIETKLAKELNAIREETSQRMDSESTTTVKMVSSIVVEYAEISVTETQFSMENFKKELQETKRDLATTSQKFTDELEVAEKNIKETTRNELKQTKATVGELWTQLNETKQELEKSKSSFEKTIADFNKTINDLSIQSTETKQKFEKNASILEKIKANLNQTTNDLSIKLTGTRKELAETITASARNLSTELKSTNSVVSNLTKQLDVTKKELEATRTALNSTRNELVNVKSNVVNLTTKLNDRTSEIVDIGKMPSSCADLQRMGHKLSGFFSVKGSKMMEMVYCNFSSGKDLHKWIGYADVKSAPVHFYVQRSSPFTKKLTKIPFDLARVNVGNAMNLTSGIFTAPRPGIYFFSFTGLAAFPTSSSPSYVKLEVGLFLNGNKIGSGFVEEANTVDFQLNPLGIQSTLNLKKDDQIWVAITDLSPKVYLFDDHVHFTHFTGFMLEEEIGASL